MRSISTVDLDLAFYVTKVSHFASNLKSCSGFIQEGTRPGHQSLSAFECSERQILTSANGTSCSARHELRSRPFLFIISAEFALPTNASLLCFSEPPPEEGLDLVTNRQDAFTRKFGVELKWVRSPFLSSYITWPRLRWGSPDLTLRLEHASAVLASGTGKSMYQASYF